MCVTYIEKNLYELEEKHNWKTCARERLQNKSRTTNDTKDEAVLMEVDDGVHCDRCYEFDSHVQLLRLSRLRYQLFLACRVPSTQPRRSLLYDMAALFVMLRTESRRDPNDVDMYLFFQVTYALTRLHQFHFIYLTNQTKNRYFTLWLMYFVEYSLDSVIYWDDYYKIVSFVNARFPYETVLTEEQMRKQHKCQLQKVFRLLTALLFVRRQQIPDSCLHVAKHPESWDAFVDQINQSYEVAKLRKEYSFSGFLFSMDVRRIMEETSV